MKRTALGLLISTVVGVGLDLGLPAAQKFPMVVAPLVGLAICLMVAGVITTMWIIGDLLWEMK